MKLLTRTIRNYVIFSGLLILVSTPLFYFSIQRLFVHGLDVEILSHKREFYELLPLIKTEADLNFFSLLNDEFVLRKENRPFERDSFMTLNIYNEKEKELHPYRILRTGVSILGDSYLLQIQESLVNTRDLVTTIVTIQVILLTLLFIGFVVINQKLTTTVWAPFYTILDKLKKYQIDKDTSIDLPPSSTTEFRELSEAIAELVNKSLIAFQSQKEFTENASHELQTPLAICRSKLELLTQTKELTREQAELVEGLFDALHRITKLMRDLLLLSKIENRQFLDVEKIEVRQITMKCLDSLHRLIQEKELRMEVNVSETLIVNANPILLEVLISNLISNAVRYSLPGSTISIKGSKERFIISNPGVPLEHPEKMFQRFHREQRTVLGNGLGLSIVKKVCEISGYSISYSYSSPNHQFELVLN